MGLIACNKEAYNFMEDKILDLSKKFMEIPSTEDNSNALEKVLDIAKEELEGFNFKEYEKDGKKSIVFYNSANFPEKFKIILNAHLDVVPARDDQFKPKIKDGKLYGRGAYDMKAAAAVEILVFKELAKKVKYPLGLQLVTDEEISGMLGTFYQIQEGVKADFVIAGEPTDFGINNKAKGVLWLKIFCKGVAAHGAYPWSGENALWKMKIFLDKLYEIYPVPLEESWKTTVNLAKIETSNKTFNKVPDDCWIYLDVRHIPEEEKEVLGNIKNILPESFEMEVLEDSFFHHSDHENENIQALKKVIEDVTGEEAKTIAKHGASDVRFYTQVGSDAVTFGPRGKGLHSDEEYVEVKSLSDFYLILKNFLVSI